jgi:hypothetical protein
MDVPTTVGGVALCCGNWQIHRTLGGEGELLFQETCPCTSLESIICNRDFQCSTGAVDILQTEFYMSAWGPSLALTLLVWVRLRLRPVRPVTRYQHPLRVRENLNRETTYEEAAIFIHQQIAFTLTKCFKFSAFIIKHLPSCLLQFSG